MGCKVARHGAALCQRQAQVRTGPEAAMSDLYVEGRGRLVLYDVVAAKTPSLSDPLPVVPVA